MDEHGLSGPSPISRRGRCLAGLRRARGPMVFLGLALLPILAACLGYYRQIGPESGIRQLHGDQVFYAYQITRAAEVGGRWWKIADDPRLGWPYQSIVAKHPGLFEGVDLLWISSLSARLLDPALNYHFLVVVVLAINGWIAGWLVHRLTGSFFWAAVAICLITWNEPVSVRITGHLHLFKFGWLLLAVWAFSRYLEAPSVRRGVVLGLAVAWVLQGSFYFAYFLVLTLGVWWLGCLIAGRLDRRHAAATAAAMAAFLLAAAALTFPIWTITKRYLLADQFAQRPLKHTWLFSSEPWQLLVSRGDRYAAKYIAEVGAKGPEFYVEGWSFPGYAVLAGIAVYVIGRVRGRRFCDSEGGQKLLDLLMGQIALLVVLSLPGGPSYFLFPWVPSIRCYGRAAMMALVGLGSVAAPLVFHGLTRGCRFRITRAAIMGAVLALVASDGSRLQTVFAWPPPSKDTTPAWVDWLAKQPPEVKLAALGPLELDYWYGTLTWALRHNHTALNGGDFELLEGDLSLLGASYWSMNQDGLRFLASLGYETLAIHRDYLDRHPWMRSVPWLETRADLGDWLIFEVSRSLPRFPAVSPTRLLARQETTARPAPVEVPVASWITGQLDLKRTVVVTRPERISLVWADAAGRLVTKPCVALFQHVLGPDLPAYTIETPARKGKYQLVFLDEKKRWIGSKPFLVKPGLLTSRQAFRRRPPEFTISPVTVQGEPCRSDRLRVVLENRSPYYIQAHVRRDPGLASARTQPGMTPPSSGSMILEINYMDGAAIHEQVRLVMPHDLPPRTRHVIDLPIQWRDTAGPSSKLVVFPKLVEVEPRKAPEPHGDVALHLEETPARIGEVPASDSVRE